MSPLPEPESAWGLLLSATVRAALFHAGWLVQAQWGMALSWSLWGGLGGVALWWVLLAFFSARPQRLLSRRQLGALALLAAGGMVAAMSASAWPLRMLGWLTATLAWAWLCSQRPPFMDLSSGHKPHWASALSLLGTVVGVGVAVWLAAQPAPWTSRWPLMAALLMLAPWCLALPQACISDHRLDAPVGLMMGSLLPMAEWCRNQGWSADSATALHLLAMGLGGAAASNWQGNALRHPGHAGPGQRGTRLACAAWLAAAMLCLWATPAAMLAVAALVAAASVHLGAKMADPRPSALIGALLLLGVGELGTSKGPDALRLVLAPTLVLMAVWHGVRAKGLLAGTPAGSL